ncbi:MAG: nucleotidyltransferase domain-containing protein [Anaerolineales bacterium]
MNLRFGLQEATIQKINTVLSRYPQVEQAILYGSRAKGNYKNGSDIDLTLCGGDDLTLNVLYRIMDELDDLLLPYTMDVSIFNDIEDEALIGHIRRVGVKFYVRGEVQLKEVV